MLITSTALPCGARVLPTGLTNVPRVSRASLHSRCSQRRPSVVQAQLGGSGEDTKSASRVPLLGQLSAVHELHSVPLDVQAGNQKVTVSIDLLELSLYTPCLLPGFLSICHGVLNNKHVPSKAC